jgi:hypothetical protein
MYFMHRSGKIQQSAEIKNYSEYKFILKKNDG